MGGVGGRDSGVVVLGRTAAGPGPADAGGDLITVAGDAHLATIAPRQSGEDQSCLLPNLLAYPGQAVVVDVDGRAYDATAAARRALGQAVVRLDPFGVTGQEPDALDPLDLLNGLAEPTATSWCLDIAGLLSLRHYGGAGADGADGEAFGLLAALIGYVHAAPGLGTFDALYQALHEEEFSHSIAVALDTAGKHLPAPSYMELTSYLSRDEWLRTRILATLRSRFGALGTPEVRRSLSRTTVPLSGMGAGEPATVYLVLPAGQVAACSVLLRLWVGTLLLGTARARDRAACPTLFLLDRCADLGSFPLLEALLTQGSGGAARIWTFWRDVHQLRTTHPGRWREIISGCGAVQAFATRDAAAAAEAEALLGLPAGDVWSLGPADQILRVDGTPRRARRLAP
jgi:type IV secretion system protein VirD4